MKHFNLTQYLRRAVKQFLYLAIFLLIIIAGFLLLGNYREGLFQPGADVKIALVFVFFSLIYPFIGFTRREIYLNGPFAERKAKIIEIMKECGYSLENDTVNEVSFVLISKFTRLFRAYEDRITLYISDDTVEMEGLRKEVFRLSRRINQTEALESESHQAE